MITIIHPLTIMELLNTPKHFESILSLEKKHDELVLDVFFPKTLKGGGENSE